MIHGLLILPLERRDARAVHFVEMAGLRFLLAQKPAGRCRSAIAD